MPCFKGLAVSIHTPEGPIAEYSIQKQSRQSRISAYIPVPPPKLSPDTGLPEQSTFAISITLLTPGSGVPYSRPSPTKENPYPAQKIVGGLPGTAGDRGQYQSVIHPYIPLTSSPNETVAAYIHFDGRAKEEVATLLRRGVETWVNSRWVSVPDSEGGGLAEREFLFREVGLERWLNGLDLEGESKEIAARIERRKERLEKKRRRRMEEKAANSDDDGEDDPTTKKRLDRNGVLRYGDNKSSPVEDVLAEEDMFTSNSDSEDEMPMTEAAGQIKVSLFRVLASGEIKRGEYSPQFDAHDDDDDKMQESNGEAGHDADVDHTTTFAKPKTLDPKSISTQTVTGIDPPDKPYATFTFFYRGQKQLQKMGILPNQETNSAARPATAKRKSRTVDFSSLTPLKPKSAERFSGYRDSGSRSSPSAKNKDLDDDMESDADDDDAGVRLRPSDKFKRDDDVDEDGKVVLSAEEASKRGELAEGVKKIQLKRQHSFEPPALAGSSSPERKSSTTSDALLGGGGGAGAQDAAISGTEPSSSASNLGGSSSAAIPSLKPQTSDGSPAVGSPFKKQRASIPFDEAAKLFPDSTTSTAPSASSGLSASLSASASAPTPSSSGGLSFGGTGSTPSPLSSDASKLKGKDGAGVDASSNSSSGGGGVMKGDHSKGNQGGDDGDIEIDEEL